MQPPDGDLFNLSGEFRDVEPPGSLAYTFRWDPPHSDDRETVVTLTLEDRGEETQICLAQGVFATVERYALHEAGWIESFERLQELLLHGHRRSAARQRRSRPHPVWMMRSVAGRQRLGA